MLEVWCRFKWPNPWSYCNRWHLKLFRRSWSVEWGIHLNKGPIHWKGLNLKLSSLDRSKIIINVLKLNGKNKSVSWRPISISPTNQSRPICNKQSLEIRIVDSALWRFNPFKWVPKLDQAQGQTHQPHCPALATLWDHQVGPNALTWVPHLLRPTCLRRPAESPFKF